MNKKYIIVKDVFGNGGKMYLCWQPYDYDSGYFWTWGECIQDCLKYNDWPHRFIFTSEEEAKKLAKSLNLSDCKIESINI